MPLQVAVSGAQHSTFLKRSTAPPSPIRTLPMLSACTATLAPCALHDAANEACALRVAPLKQASIDGGLGIALKSAA